MSSGGGSGGDGTGGRGLPLAAIIGVATAAAASVGLVAGVAVAAFCRRRRARRAEERQRAFEAVFSDPELELEEVAAEVRRSITYNPHTRSCLPVGGFDKPVVRLVGERQRAFKAMFSDSELEDLTAEVHRSIKSQD